MKTADRIIIRYTRSRNSWVATTDILTSTGCSFLLPHVLYKLHLGMYRLFYKTQAGHIRTHSLYSRDFRSVYCLNIKKIICYTWSSLGGLQASPFRNTRARGNNQRFASFNGRKKKKKRNCVALFLFTRSITDQCGFAENSDWTLRPHCRSTFTRRGFRGYDCTHSLAAGAYDHHLISSVHLRRSRKPGRPINKSMSTPGVATSAKGRHWDSTFLVRVSVMFRKLTHICSITCKRWFCLA